MRPRVASRIFWARACRSCSGRPARARIWLRLSSRIGSSFRCWASVSLRFCTRRSRICSMVRGPPDGARATRARLRTAGRGGTRARAGITRRPEAEGRIGDLQHAGLLGHHELHVRRHPRQETAPGIVDGDDDDVGDDVLDDQRRLADLGHGAAERLPGEGVDGEGRPVLDLDAADVGLIHARLHLHLREILGDREERRRLEAGRHRLPDVDGARDDDAVDRGADHRAVEIHLRLLERGLALLDLGARRLQRRPRPP